MSAPMHGPTLDSAFRENVEVIRRYLARRLGRDRAEDATSETFLVACRRWKDRPGDNSTVITCWLLAIARNVSLHGLRDMQRDARTCELSASESPQRRVERTPAAEASVIAVLNFIGALESLVPQDKAVLALVAQDQPSMVELGERLGVTASAAANRLMMARRRFRDALC